MTNALKRLCRSRELKLGHFLIEFATPGIGHILKGAGCDFAFIDMEHSGFSFETVKSAVRYCEAAQLPAIVRVPSKSYHHIARAADIGAEAVMVPMVDTDAEARELVSHLKYTPLGARGVALGIAHDNFRGAGPVHERLAAANERTCLFALIETASGVEHVDAIAAVEGVDGLWIGHFDLSSSLGIPGEFTHPKFADAVERIGAAAHRHGKALGRLVPDAASGIDHAARGFDFVCWSGDVWALQEAVRGGLDAIRAGARPAAGRPKQARD
jgi:2-keto-3-deoxy-L-rhamnonate aldolase RhmA